MRWMKRMLAAVGGVAVVGLVFSIAAPKSVHALVAALVQVVPGTTTHVGQNEGNLVSLACYFDGVSGVCQEESPSTGSVCCVAPAYVVPAGYTLIVTDFSWQELTTLGKGMFFCDWLAGTTTTVYNPYFSSQGCSETDSSGNAVHESHYTTGLRFASGLSLSNYQWRSVSGLVSSGITTIHGYIVPN